MLDCKLCNYYQTRNTLTSENNTAKCEFTGLVFVEDVENMNIDYPCKNVSFAEYQKRKANPQAYKNQGLKFA